MIHKKLSIHLIEIYKLQHYFAPHKKKLLVVMIAAIINAIAVLSMGVALSEFIDQGVHQPNNYALTASILLLILLVSILAFFTFIRSFYIATVGEKVIASIRTDIFRKVLQLPPMYHDQQPMGEIIARMSSDATLLLGTLGSSFSVAIRNLVMFTLGIIMMWWYSPLLSALILCAIPCIIAPIIVLAKRNRLVAGALQISQDELLGYTEQAIQLIRTIQSYTREEFELQKFTEKTEQQMRLAAKRNRLKGWMSASIIFLAFTGIAMIMWYGGYLVNTGKLSAGQLSSFIYIAAIVSGALASLSDVVGDLQKASMATERIMNFLRQPNLISNSKNCRAISNVKGNITFHHVLFSYPDETPLFNRLSFEIKAGQVTAIVGKSGSGKSSIFALLQRFYIWQSGDILLDGVNIKDITLQSLRSNLVYAPQEAKLFQDTIYNNIIYGNLQASEEAVWEAATQAQCLEFIGDLKNGIHTLVNNAKLSVGQKQRILLARAMLADPAVLLLDEATTALDVENEMLVQNAVNKLMQNRTTIIISHHFSKIMKADQIIVIDQGRVVASGSHNELSKEKTSLYNKLLEISVA